MHAHEIGATVMDARGANGPPPGPVRRPLLGSVLPTGYDRMTPKTWAFSAVMVVLAIVGVTVWLLMPDANPLLTVFLYSIPANCAVSLFPHEPLLVAFGRTGLSVWSIALAATLGTLLAGYIDYKVFAPVLNLKRAADRYRDNRYYLRANRWFYKTPFVALVVAGFSPLPFYPFKFLVFSAKYPLRRYLAALAIGRYPRYLVLTLLGYQLNPPTWLVLATFAGMFVIVYAGKIFRFVRRAACSLRRGRRCAPGNRVEASAERSPAQSYSAPMVVRMATKAIRNIRVGKPLCVSLEVTHNCTADCRHCDKGPKVDDHAVGPATYARLCAQLDPALVQIAGGEPLMRTDLAEIIRSVRRPGRPPFIAIITNGSLLTREKYLELRSAGANQFSISIDFPDARHDSWRRIPGLFAHLQSLVPGLIAMGHGDIVLNACFHRGNYRLLPEIAQLAQDWGTKLNLSPYTELRTGNKALNLRHPNDTFELDAIIDRLYDPTNGYANIMTSEKVMRRFNDFYKNGATPGCQAGRRYLVVNPDGNLTPCAMHIATRYATQKDLLRGFVAHNDCEACYISSRANTEKSFRELLADNLRFVAMSRRANRRSATT